MQTPYFEKKSILIIDDEASNGDVPCFVSANENNMTFQAAAREYILFQFALM